MEERGDHDDGEDENTEGFEPSTPDRVGVLVAAGDEFGGRPHDSCAEEVKRCVDEGGENREGASQDNDGDFSHEKNGVGGQIDIDGNRNDGTIAIFTGICSRVLDLNRSNRRSVIGGIELAE